MIETRKESEKPACWICRRPFEKGQGKEVSTDRGVLRVHSECLLDMAAVIRAASEDTGVVPPSTGLSRVARRMGERIVLVHRSFPNDQIPILIYLAHFSEPQLVPAVYEWLRQNELRIDNPSLGVLRLTRKGLLTTFREGDSRFVMLTEAGRRAVDDYAASLARGENARGV